MASIVYSDDHYDQHGLVASTRRYDDGTVEEVEGGKVVYTRPATPAEQARAAEYAAGPQPTTDEHIATLEADLAVAKEQAAKADALQAILVDKGVIAEADVVAIDAPVDEIAKSKGRPA